MQVLNCSNHSCVSADKDIMDFAFAFCNTEHMLVGNALFAVFRLWVVLHVFSGLGYTI